MKKLLIVIDMQNDFINGSLGTKEAQLIIPNVYKKVEEYKNKKFPIFVTRDTHNENYLETSEGKNLPVKHCLKNTEGWNLNPTIKNSLKDYEVTYYNKPTFGSTELVKDLGSIFQLFNTVGIDEIELIGVCTDICVISNAILIKNFFPEIKITVDSNCCAGVTPEKHQAALETMKSCQINVI